MLFFIIKTKFTIIYLVKIFSKKFYWDLKYFCILKTTSLSANVIGAYFKNKQSPRFFECKTSSIVFPIKSLLIIMIYHNDPNF